jgi:hypothetical protein
MHDKTVRLPSHDDVMVAFETALEQGVGSGQLVRGLMENKAGDGESCLDT